MTYQQAGRIAVLKRILGWVIFIPALISTLISLLKFMNTRQENQEGINAVMLDFTHVMIDMMQANTPFLNLFWYNSPTPNFNGGVNVMFWVIFHPDFCRTGVAGFRCPDESPGALLAGRC